MNAAVFVLVLLVIGAIAFGSYYMRQKRRDELAQLAKQFALTYTRDDPYDLLRYPFDLLRKGDGRGCENVLSGSWQGLMVKEADYWYYDQSTDSKGNTQRSYSRFSITITDLSLIAPYVSVAKETLLTRAADHLGLKDIDFESEQFNREFNVKCPDREFVFKLIDARMEQFLLDSGGRFGFELDGASLLVYCKRLPPLELVPLLGTLKGFVDHVPRLVWNEYGTPGATAEG